MTADAVVVVDALLEGRTREAFAIARKFGRVVHDRARLRDVPLVLGLDARGRTIIAHGFAPQAMTWPGVSMAGNVAMQVDKAGVIETFQIVDGRGEILFAGSVSPQVTVDTSPGLSVSLMFG